MRGTRSIRPHTMLCVFIQTTNLARMPCMHPSPHTINYTYTHESGHKGARGCTALSLSLHGIFSIFALTAVHPRRRIGVLTSSELVKTLQHGLSRGKQGTQPGDTGHIPDKHMHMHMRMRTYNHAHTHTQAKSTGHEGSQVACTSAPSRGLSQIRTQGPCARASTRWQSPQTPCAQLQA